MPGGKWVAAACLAVLAACSEEGPAEPVVGEQMELAAARGLWNAHGSDDYRMTVRLTGAWWNGAAVIWVRNGVPVAVQSVAGGSEVPREVWRSYDTVDELFALVERAVQENAHFLAAEYHSSYGLPVDVFVDMRQNMVDDEQGFIVETFDRP
ncbi:MAG TPA: DUF6174 domain-containing protein [Longimicrobium sp.]|nr:DUF6174 domain-containing protein [Longimicrobium sp.]